MEASTTGAPAAAEQQPTQPTEQAAQPAAPEQQIAPTIAPQQQPQAPTQQPTEEQKPEPTLSDVAESLAEMRKEFDERMGGAGQEQAAGDGEAGLLDALLGEPEEEAGQEQQQQAAPGQEPGTEGFDPNDPAFQAFQSYLDQHIDERVSPIQEERHEEQLVALEKKYPDILDEKVFPRVSQALDNVVRRSGNEALRLDPAMIELAYQAVKAQLADATAVPAEQAATDATSIETGAGQSQAGQPTQADQYVQSVYGGGKKKSVFQ